MKMEHAGPAHNISYIRHTGEYHNQQNAGCDDVVYTYTAPRLEFYGLADGQSGKSMCTCGGNRVLQAIAHYLEQKGIAQICDYAYTDELQYEIVTVIRKTIGMLAEQMQVKREEFSSTVVVFAFDPETRAFVTIHLGDGGILGVSRDGELEMINAPENGITLQYTWLTTSPQALSHIKIFKGNVDRYKRVLLITDGATGICCGRNITAKAEKLLKMACTQEQLLQLAARSTSQDDASCIVVDFD